MEKCACMQEWISRMLDEDLSADEQAALAKHLESCETCRTMYEAFSAVSVSLGGELEEPPESLRENVMAEIRREEIRKKNRRGRRVWTVAASAAVLALVLGLRFGPAARMGAVQMSASVQELAAAAEETADTEEAALEMPAAAAKAAGSVEDAAAEEAAAEEAAPRLYAANAAADTAVPEAPAEAYDRGAAASGPAEQIDLSFLRYAELLEKLNGEPAAVELEKLEDPETVVLVCADNMLALFACDGDWYYHVASDPTPRRSSLGLEEIRALAEP